ncbi:response regulator [Bhargavaea ginsengi]|uniref:response regulator n=1 Tax=Bhargavaea ginsengi TaxID=426757 RepID=UPI00203FBF99|nr:response regulator [Bhargavaea ginsengi]MCM3087503.1 response regulator [Bhargavaea ginsengi]
MIRVLIVEDDFRIAGIHEGFLGELPGVEVVGKVLTGSEAVKAVQEQAVNLVLLDVYMPDTTGVELIPKLRMIRPELDFIIISAAVEHDIVSRLLNQGVTDYIIKPVKKERFIEAIARYKMKRERIGGVSDFDQAVLDRLLGVSVEAEQPAQAQTPKGIDPLTLDKVRDTLQQLDAGITAEEMGEQIGASRTTARRYLEYLISESEAIADLEYGAVGRPERKYFINKNS